MLTFLFDPLSIYPSLHVRLTEALARLCVYVATSQPLLYVHKASTKL